MKMTKFQKFVFFIRECFEMKPFIYNLFPNKPQELICKLKCTSMRQAFNLKCLSVKNFYDFCGLKIRY